MFYLDSKIENTTFTQKPSVYALTECENDVVAFPVILLGGKSNVIAPPELNYTILGYLYGEATKHFKKHFEAEKMFLETANSNMANMFYCYINNIFVEDEIRHGCSVPQNSASKGMLQEFIDFMAAVVNEIQKENIQDYFLVDNVKSVVVTLLQTADAPDFIYPVLSHVPNIITRYHELYRNQEKSDSFGDFSIGDKDSDFFESLFK